MRCMGENRATKGVDPMRWMKIAETGYEVTIAGKVRRCGTTKILKPSNSGSVCLNVGTRDSRIQRTGISFAISAAVASMPWTKKRDTGEVKTK